MNPKDFLAGIQTEGLIQPIESEADDKGKETPAASPAENKPQEAAKVEAPKEEAAPEAAKPDGSPAKGTEAAPSGGDQPADPNKPEGQQAQDEQVPFHKHPRWKKLNDDNKSLREQNTQMNDRLAALELAQTEAKKGEVPPIPDWFSNQFGDDEDAWKDFLATVDKRAGKEPEAAKAAAKAEPAGDDDAKWERWVDDEVEKLEDDPAIGAFDRNRLLLIANEYLPTDAEGNISLRKAYDIMAKLDKDAKAKTDDKIEAKKKVAGNAAPSPAPAAAANKPLTSKDVRGKSFRKLLMED